MDNRRALTQPAGVLAALAGFAGNRRHCTTGACLAPIIGLFVLAYLLPLGQLIWRSVHGETGFTLANHAALFHSPAFATIVLRTLIMAAVVTVLCLTIGYPLAYVLSRLRGPVVIPLLLVVSIPYVTSILIRTYAWIVVLGPSGVINHMLLSLGLIDHPLTLVFNTLGVYVGMVQVQLPVMVFPLYAAMKRIDTSLVAAASSLGSDPASAFCHVFAPLSMPGIISGCTLVFLSCIGFYVTPSLLGGAGNYMVAEGITVRVTRLADFNGASAQATFLLAFVVLLFVLFRKRLAAELGMHEPDSSASSGEKRRAISERMEWMRIRIRPLITQASTAMSAVGKPLSWTIAVFGLCYLLIPLLVVIPLAFSDAAYLTFPPPAYSTRWFSAFFANRQWLEATGFSIEMSAIAALASMALGVPAAFAIVRGDIKAKVPLYLLLISPLVIPQVVAAVALYFMLAHLQLAGTRLGFLIAYTLIGAPYVVVMVIAGLRRFDQTVEMAAASLGARPLSVLRTVSAPLLLPTLLGSLVFAFIAGFDDVVFGLFLSGPGAEPLPIRMWDDIRQEVSPQIAVVAVLLLSAFLIFFIARRIAVALIRRARHEGAKQTW